MNLSAMIKHYDALIDENNDPVHDPAPLQAYMDGWDGQQFIDNLCLSPEKSILEIGVGTGRLAIRVAPLCGEFYGIDPSPKTIDRAKENLAVFENVRLILDDFMTHEFSRTFDVIYSSLTFMHIEDSRSAIQKVQSLLNKGGIFVLSIDKDQSGCIDTGTRKIKVYPDDPEKIEEYLHEAGFAVKQRYETQFAAVFAAEI